MGITLLLYLCLSHHGDYFLGPVVKLPVKWSRGRSSMCSSVCAKARGQTNQAQRLRWARSRHSASSARVSPKDGSFGSEAGIKSWPLHYSKINCQDFWLKLVITVKLSHPELPVLHT